MSKCGPQNTGLVKKAVFILCLLPVLCPSARAADQFSFTLAPSVGTLYGVNQAVSFHVEARNGGSIDTGFSQTVTVGLYDYATKDLPVPILSDPKALILDGGSNTGTAVLNFSAGQLGFQAVFKTGADNEVLLIRHSTITLGNFAGPYTVVGYTSPYYLQDTNGDNIPAVFPPNTDILNPDPAVAVDGASDVAINIPYSAAGDGSDAAAVYVISGVNGQYAAGGAGVTTNLWVKKTNISGNPPAQIKCRVIVDFNGNLTPPYVPSTSDAVYESSSVYNPGTSYSYLSQPSPQLAYANIVQPTGMNNGKIILIVWSNSGPASVVSQLRIKAATDPLFASTIISPYSDSNVSPVEAVLTPKEYLAGAAATMYYNLKNLSGQAISQTRFIVPANPGGTGVSWSLLSVDLPPGHSGSSASFTDPNGSTPGYVDINWGTTPMTVSENATVTLQVRTASAVVTQGWDFGLTIINNTFGMPVNGDSYAAQDIQTLDLPDSPSGFAASPVSLYNNGNAVSLAWGQVTNQFANGYVLSRRPSGSPTATFTPVATFTSTVQPNNAPTSFVDASVANLSSYDYTIAARNTVALSPPVTLQNIVPFANPGPPTGLGALTGGTTIRLNWTAPVSVAGSFSPGGYDVYRGTVPDGETYFAQIPVVTTWDDTSVSAGTTYYYKLASIDNQSVTGTPGTGAHISGYSAEVSGFPPGNPPLSAAASFYAGSSPTTIELTWQAPVSNLNTPVNYVIERSLNGSSPTTILAASSPATYLDIGIAPGNFCVYRIAAVDGLPVTTNYCAAVTGRVGPSAPVSFRASPSAGAITLTWNANPPAENVLSYVVFRNSSQIFNVAGTAVTSITGISQGTDYLYEVEAVDNAGVTGPRSSLSSALLPNTPASFGVTANATVRSNVDMAWTAPPNGGNVTGYNIYRNTIPSIPATPIATPTATLVFQDTTLSSANAGTTYFYFLQAQNIGGAGPVTMRGLQIPPNPPTGIAASSTAATITVNWTARPTVENVSRYDIYRIPLPTGTPQVVGTATPGTATSFNDGTAQTGQDYSYYVSATNPGGGGVPGGESLASSYVTQGRLPQVPGGFATGVSLTAPDSSTVTFTWAAVTQVDPNAAAVIVYENGAAASTLSASSTLYINSSASASTTYTYNLAVTNAYGTGATAATPVSRLTYPTTVTLNPITLLPNNVYMATSWTTVGSGDVSSYRVYRSLNGGTYSLVQTIPASTLTFPVTFTYPVQYGQEYSFEIGAVNPTGEGRRSNPQTVRTGPSVPTGLAAASGISTSSLGVSLTWNANPAPEGVDTYTLYRSQSVSLLGSYVTIGTLASPTTFYEDSSALTDKAIYYYLLSASGGGLESYLNTVNARAVTAFMAPNTSSPPTTDAANASATLTWAAVAATSYPVTGYNLIRTDPAGTTQVNSAPITGLSYVDTGLTNGVTYFYALQARDDQGHLGALSAPVSVQPLAPPGVPGNFSGGAGEYATQLSWDPATSGTLPLGGYLLFRYAQPGGPMSMIYQAPATTVAYVDTNGGTGLAAGVMYDYWIQAFDSSGVTTGLHIGSSSVTVSLSATGNVNPPSNIIATASPSSVYITWTDSFAPGAYPVTGYQLMRAVSQAGPYSQIASPVTAATNPNSYTDASVTNGIRYYYYFVALDTVPQTSINSVTVTALPARPPEVPAGFVAADGVSQVALGWNAAVTVDNAPVSAYVVYRAILPGAPAVAATVFSPAVTFTDTGLSTPATCLYSLGVININGTAGTSQSTTVTGYPYAEFAPTGLSSVASNAAVTLNWTPNGSPSYAVTGFSVIRTTPAGGTPTTLAAASPLYTDITATAGQLFIYQVQALDLHGHSSLFSSPVTDGPANPPSAPSPFMIFAGASQNLLDWGDSVPATPGGLPVSLYVVIGSNGVSAVLPATQTWYLDETAVDGSPVTYTVTAIDESGRLTAGVHASTAAGPVSATSSASNVNPPTELTATATAPTSIVLTWERPNDQGRVINYYTVFRASSLAALYSSPTSIAQVDNPALAPVTQFVDTGVSADTDYYYMLRATDAINLAESSNSNHAWARTPRPLRPVPPVTSGVMAFDANLFKPLEGEDLAIYFILPTAGSVEIDIYNVAGRHVQYLYLGERAAGVTQSVLWDGKDHGGNVVSSGIYLIEIKAPGFHQVNKVAVVK